MPPAKQILAFLCASMVLSALIYRDAMWGSSLLAPLDLGPDLFPHYRFMDPEADGIPENHHIADQFTYDLPLQAAIHRAYRQGEIPWWDPYTYGGRPLLADAHVNGTDPVRLLCYRLLPFDLAYNWNYILRGLLTGLGMFLLLSTLGVRALAAGILAIAYQFAGWFTLFFGHPWIQGSFVYFPFIWLLWSRAISGNFAKNTALAGLACGLVFYAGNLQSHTYLPLFAVAFIGSFASRHRKILLPRALGVCALSGVIGALLAFPVLANQVEFYLISLRPVEPGSAWYAKLASLPCALASLYPWALGTFRTLEPAKLVGGAGTVFPLFFGAVGSFLAILGAFRYPCLDEDLTAAQRMAILLVLLYLLIISTPLAAIFYSRSAALAGMGLTVLAGIALQALLDDRLRPSGPWLRGFAIFMVAGAIGSSCMAWFVYPKVRPFIERKMASESAQSSYGASTSIAAMRSFQIESFPKEVSLRNPEATMTILATLLFTFAMLRNQGINIRSRNSLVLLALGLSVVPLVMFHARFRPKHPIALWHRMEAGGEAQKQAIAMARGGLRMDETEQTVYDMIFPKAVSVLYRIHCVQGYSALQPPGVFRYPADAPTLAAEWQSDLKTDDSRVYLTAFANRNNPRSRFRRASDGGPADVSILNETFNSLTLDISRHDLSVPLIRTDTYYPGWHAVLGAPVTKFDPCFSKISPTQGSNHTLALRYSLSMCRLHGPAIGLGAGSILLLIFFPFACNQASSSLLKGCVPGAREKETRKQKTERLHL